MSTDRRTSPAFEAAAGVEPLVDATFIPQRYEPNYAYPLLVMLHSRGGDEQQMVRSMPALSWRNYVAVGLRGPEPVVKRGNLVGHGWGPAFGRIDRHTAPPEPATPPAEVLRRLLFEDALEPVDRLEEGIFAAIRQTMRGLHVHSERIFLVGSGEGAAVAYKLALSYPEKFAGVVAINGWLPPRFPALARLKACRDLRILVVHGEWNARASVEHARRDVAMLRAGGLHVAFQAYPCAHRLTSPMLADVDTWLINQCTRGL